MKSHAFTGKNSGSLDSDELKPKRDQNSLGKRSSRQAVRRAGAGQPLRGPSTTSRWALDALTDVEKQSVSAAALLHENGPSNLHDHMRRNDQADNRKRADVDVRLEGHASSGSDMSHCSAMGGKNSIESP